MEYIRKNEYGMDLFQKINDPEIFLKIQESLKNPWFKKILQTKDISLSHEWVYHKLGEIGSKFHAVELVKDLKLLPDKNDTELWDGFCKKAKDVQEVIIKIQAYLIRHIVEKRPFKTSFYVTYDFSEVHSLLDGRGADFGQIEKSLNNTLTHLTKFQRFLEENNP